jgi:hypothetical protein
VAPIATRIPISRRRLATVPLATARMPVTARSVTSAAQAARGVAHVLPHALEARFPADVANPVLDCSCTAELEPCCAFRIRATHPGCELRLDRGVEKAVQFFAQLPVVLPPGEDADAAADEPSHGAHQISSGVAFRILVIAAVCVSHAAVCSRNAARRAVVRA